jgi:hypothetical protein
MLQGVGNGWRRPPRFSARQLSHLINDEGRRVSPPLAPVAGLVQVVTGQAENDAVVKWANLPLAASMKQWLGIAVALLSNPRHPKRGFDPNQ